MTGFVSALVIIAVVAVLVMVAMIAKNLYICQPNEVLIFSGPSRRVAGKRIGYKVIKGGRRFRVPLLERVDRMDLTNMPIDIRVEGAYCKGGIPLEIDAVANVKIAGEGVALSNAIERFLGKSRDEIIAIARETLEGNLRGVLAQLTPEQVNEDKVSFAKSLQEEAEADLAKLGLDLDNLKIQNVTDAVGYLDSIGRAVSAELQRRSLVAEAQAKAEAAEKDAENQRQTAIAEIAARTQMVQAEVDKRVMDAVTKKQAMVVEQRSQVEALIAKAEAELEMQQARIVQVRERLEADVIQPALAERDRAIEKAKADAAPIIEEGKASVQALEEAIAAWKRAGSNARDVFLINKLEPIMRTLLSTIGEVNIEQLTLLQAGASDGKGDAALDLVALSEKLKAGMGLDLAQAVRHFAGQKEEAARKAPPKLPAQ